MLEESELLELVFEHVCEHQAEEVAALSDAEIEERCKAAVGRARRYGFVKEASIAAFVSLTFVVAPRFDDEPAIRSALEDSKLPPDQRIARIFENTPESCWDSAAERR